VCVFFGRQFKEGVEKLRTENLRLKNGKGEIDKVKGVCSRVLGRCGLFLFFFFFCVVLR